MIFGVRAHDFGKMPLEDLAQTIADNGFTSIQLALAKALPQIDSSLGRLNPGMANYIGETFHRHGIQIAVLGCYINPVHPNPDMRKQSLARFKEHLRFARDFGCSVVATETGSVNADCSFHPDNSTDRMLYALIDSVRELVETAEKFGVLACVEGVTQHIMNTPKRINQVIESVGTSNLQVLFDPANITPATAPESCEDLVDESLELFGNRIQILHAKDFIVENGIKKAVPFGQGCLPWDSIMPKILKRKPYINILIEDNPGIEAIKQSADGVKTLLDKIQIR